MTKFMALVAVALMPVGYVLGIVLAPLMLGIEEYIFSLEQVPTPIAAKPPAPTQIKAVPPPPAPPKMCFLSSIAPLDDVGDAPLGDADALCYPDDTPNCSKLSRRHT